MLDDRVISNDRYNDLVDLFKKREFESLIKKIKCLEEDKFAEHDFFQHHQQNLLNATYEDNTLPQAQYLTDNE